MTAMDRRSAIISALLIFFLGLALGFMAGDDFNFDRHSYRGGVSYVVTRDHADPFVTIDPLSACLAYVNSGMNAVDGYLSAKDFIQGCRDAYADRHQDVGATMSIAIENWIVLRPAPCVDVEKYPPILFYSWLDIGDVTSVPPAQGCDPLISVGNAVPSGEFMVHPEDGSVAEIYVIHNSVHTCG